jgi:hypothetical protein
MASLSIEGENVTKTNLPTCFRLEVWSCGSLRVYPPGEITRKAKMEGKKKD